MSMEIILESQLWGNSGKQWILAIIFFIGAVIVFKIFSSLVILKLKKISKKTKTSLDDFLVGLIKNIKPPFYYFMSLYGATKLLQLNQLAGKIVFGVFLITTVYQAIIILQKIIDFVIKGALKSSDDEIDPDKEAIVRLIGQLTKVALWIVGALLILSNFGIDITSLIAGLGIGGIAIALALQNILGDMFASFSIFIDKPFKVGDFISISPTEKGTVEKIGIKTTRVKTLQGQQIVVSNKKLTDSSVENFRRMEKRRVNFGFGVTYETPVEKLREIPKMVEEIIESKEKVKFNRAHFKRLGNSSLDFKVIYTMESPEYKEYMDVQQEINFEIMERFEKEGIEFAYPTQTIFVKK